MDKQKVYVVLQGMYSDSSPVAAFDNRQAAEKFCDSIAEGSGVEELDLMSSDDDYTDCWYVHVTMERNGDVKRVDGPYLEVGVPYRKLRFRWDVYGVCLQHYSVGKDVDAAIKGANELRAQVLAMNLWPEKNDVETVMKCDEQLHQLLSMGHSNDRK